MKPRTRIQIEIAQLSKRLPKLSKAQRAYAFEHCFKLYAHRTKKGIITCLECGHQWKSEHHLAESICGCTCPHCGQLEMLDTRKRVFRCCENGIRKQFFYFREGSYIFQFCLVGKTDSDIGNLYSVTPFRVLRIDSKRLSLQPISSNIAPHNART